MWINGFMGHNALLLLVTMVRIFLLQENVKRLLDGLEEMRSVTGVAYGLTSALFRECEPMPPLPIIPRKLCYSDSEELNLFNSKHLAVLLLKCNLKKYFKFHINGFEHLLMCSYLLISENLNESQRSAVEFLIKQQDLGVLHGPPGTGKTTVLIELIRLHVKMGIKVCKSLP